MHKFVTLVLVAVASVLLGVSSYTIIFGQTSSDNTKIYSDKLSYSVENRDEIYSELQSIISMCKDDDATALEKASELVYVDTSEAYDLYKLLREQYMSELEYYEISDDLTDEELSAAKEDGEITYDKFLPTLNSIEVYQKTFIVKTSVGSETYLLKCSSDNGKVFNIIEYRYIV